MNGTDLIELDSPERAALLDSVAKAVAERNRAYRHLKLIDHRRKAVLDQFWQAAGAVRAGRRMLQQIAESD